MESLQELRDLKTGDRIRYKVNHVSIQARLRGKQERELDKIWRQEQFCWRDVFRDQELFIFAHGYDSNKIGCALFPSTWMRFDNESLIIDEPVFEDLDEQRHWAYGFVNGDREFYTLYKALCSKTPSQKEIKEFRKTRLYSGVFK